MFCGAAVCHSVEMLVSVLQYASFMSRCHCRSCFWYFAANTRLRYLFDTQLQLWQSNSSTYADLLITVFYMMFSIVACGVEQYVLLNVSPLKYCRSLAISVCRFGHIHMCCVMNLGCALSRLLLPVTDVDYVVSFIQFGKCLCVIGCLLNAHVWSRMWHIQPPCVNSHT